MDWREMGKRRTTIVIEEGDFHDTLGKKVNLGERF